MKKFVALLLVAWSTNTWAQSKQILVVFSGVDFVSLGGGKVHRTGYFLNELATPLKVLMDQGYQPVFANPTGESPVMDAASDKASWFSSPKEYDEMKALLAGLPGL